MKNICRTWGWWYLDYNYILYILYLEIDIINLFLLPSTCIQHILTVNTRKLFKDGGSMITNLGNDYTGTSSLSAPDL